MDEGLMNAKPPIQQLGMSLCCTLADATHETNNEEQKIKNAKRGDI
jgi:hypothetical protein